MNNLCGENAVGFHLKHKTGLQNTDLDWVSQDPFYIVFSLKLAQLFSTNSIFFPHSDLVSVQIWLVLWFGLIIFVACSHLFLFLWCSILSIWNEIQVCSWSCIADGTTGWSWIGKRNNLTMRKISIWNVCFQSVCLSLGILSFCWAFWKVYFEIMRLYEVWDGLEIPKSTIYC